MDPLVSRFVKDLARTKTFKDGRPSFTEVENYMKLLFPGAERWAPAFYRAMERQGWKDKRREHLTNWRAVAKRYASAAYLRQKK